MKILGISGSSRPPQVSGTYKLVDVILKATGMEHEHISLSGKRIAGCIGCIGCADDNICVIKDDMTELRGKILEADAYVIGAPNYFATLNANTHCFLERLYQFRHRENDSLK